MTTRPFHRPARRPGPQRPRGDLLLEPPPDLPETVAGNFGQLLVYLPMAAGAGAMVFMFAGPSAGVSTYLAGGLYGMSTMGMMVGQLGRGSGEKKRRQEGERRDYLRYLTQARSRIRATADRQREAAAWDNPDPDALWSLAMTSRLWERRPTDADFGTARIAVGPQRLAMRLVAPDTKPLEDLDPIGAVALRSLIRAHAEVPELPIGVAVRSYARIALRGDEAVSRDMARAMLAQLSTFHAPADLRIAVCTSRTRAAEWAWVKWLPHAQHPWQTDGVGPVRMVAEDLGDLEELLGGDLADRPRFRPGGSGHPEAAQWVVVLDGGRVPPESQLAIGDAAGVVLLDLTGSTARDADRHLLRLEAAADGVGILDRGADGADVARPVGRPDRLSVDQAEALARVQARHRIGGGALPQPLDVTTDLPSLLGVYDLDAYDSEEFWRHRTARDRLRLPIGLGADGAPVELDIKESAQGGVGPHGLIIGATGSGKSELLRTIVLGLAVMHSSEVLNFVLVDFKGGATFLGLERLAHTSALITNLSEELPLVARMEDALRGELVRRQELLRAAGSFTSVYDYENARAQGAPLEPLPTLLVVVDEFSELLSSRPEFADLFVMIGRLGRSLGVHLMLASQRLEEGRLRGLETHLSYRICLRTFSAMESRMVIGVPDAYELPGEPGHGYMKSDVATLTRFKAAYVSGTTRRRIGVTAHDMVRESRLLPFGTSWVDPPRALGGGSGGSGGLGGSGVSGEAEGADRSAADGHSSPSESPRAPRTFDILLERLQGHGRPAHRVWLPPLDVPVTLDEMLGRIVPDPELGLVALDSPYRGTLSVPVGVEDRPFEQLRDPLVVDLSGAAGHVAVVGAPQSGKSTLLRTLICSLALTHSPREVQFYCLDFGGGALGPLEALPHVGGVAPRLRPEAVRRTVAEVVALVEGREAAFSLHGVDNMAAYRRAVREGGAVADGFGDVFLVVDGWGQLRQEHDALTQTITDLATRGLAYGVHVVVAANRWADIRQALKETISTRLELRLGEAFESEMSRQVAADVPAAMPGRGVSRDRLHFLSALPRVDGRADSQTAGDGLRDLVRASKEAWTGPSAPPVRLLPRDLTQEALFAGRPRDLEASGVPIGLGEDDLAPVLADFAADPHFLVFGESGSGKSSLMRHMADALVRAHPAEEARIVVVDYRRAMLEAIGEPHLIAYAGSPTVAEATMRDLAQVLRARLPGPEVSPAQLRDRSWWSGADLYILVDDYDLVASSSMNPMQPLVELLPHSRDIGLHLVVARTSAGAARTMTDPVVRGLRDAVTPGLLLSGGREDGPLIGTVSASAQPPGRGVLVRRNRANLLVQTPWRAPAG